MKYIINPMDAKVTGDCSGILGCNCYITGPLCPGRGPRPCDHCESKCDALCTSDCSGTDSVVSPSSFNF